MARGVGDAVDSTLWSGTLTLPAGQASADVRFLLQAANGVGLVALDDNQGSYYVPDTAPGLTPPTATEPTSLTLQAPTSGTYRDAVPVSATLAGPAPASGRTVTFSAGSASVSSVTDAGGVARADLPLIDSPGDYRITVAYDGDDAALPSAADSALTITKQSTHLVLTPASVDVPPGAEPEMAATLTAADLPLRWKSVYLVVRDGAGQVVDAVVGATNLQGKVQLGPVDLAPGSYSVTASFGADSVDLGQSTVDATDPDYVASSATATLTVQGLQGGAPDATPDSYTTVEGAVLDVAAAGVLANDTDPDGDPLQATLVSGPASGDLTLNPDGSFSYTPISDFTGTDSFTYTATDGALSSALAVVTITVTESIPDGCTIVGTSADDLLYGTDGDDVICGLGGDDTLVGGNGDDILIGGSGNDILRGGKGNDVLEGGSGDDTLYGGNGNDSLIAGLGIDRLYGDNGNDSLDAADDAGGDSLAGAKGRDSCRSDPGDVVTGCP